MSRQTAISNVNKKYREDLEQGITHEHYNSIDTAKRMLEDYKRRQKEREEEERKRRQEWLNQRSARASQDIAREAEGILQTRREAETEPVTAPRSRRENSDDYYFGDSTGTRHLGSGRDLGKLAITGNTSGKRRMEYDRNQEKLKEHEGVSSQQLYTQADLAQQTARSAQMERNRMASELAANPGLIFNQEFTQGLSGATARADATAQAASRAMGKFNTVAELRRKVDEQSNYGYLNQNPDYAKYSSGDEETAKRANNSLSPKMIRYYNIYNRGKIQSGVTSGAPAEAYVTDDEAGRYFYLWAKQGADAAEAYYNTYVKDRAQERRTNKERQNVQDLATSSPVMSAAMSAASVPLQATGIIGMIDLTIQNAERRIGINADKPINYNTAWQAPSDQASAIRESVSNKIQTDVTKNLIDSGHSEKSANLWGAAASFVYQTGMSMVDSGVQALLVRVGIPEAATLTLMAGGAGMSSIREAKQRGASDGEALAYGYAAAFAEGIFEHVSLENLMTAKTPRKFWQGVKEVAKQSFAEGSEEFATTYANTLTDMFINGGASEISQNVLSYMADGLSEKEARKTAAIHWLKNITMDFLGGAISGGAMGAGNVGVNLALNYAQDFQTGRAINDALRQEQAAPVQEQAAPQAPALTISTQETQNARRTDPLGYALEKVGNGETLTGGDARAILENPQAVQSLRDAGVLTEAVKSGNEGRKQINAAVAALAEQNRAVTTDSQQETEQNTPFPVQNQQETAQEQNAPATLSLPTAEEQQEQNTSQTLTLPTVEARQEQNAPQTLTLPTVESRTAETEEQMIDRLKKSDAGLAQDDYTATMDQRTVKLLDTLAKKLGLRVAFADEVNRGKANADITGNVVLIEKGNPNPVRFLIGHEATHWMKRNADGGYNAFEKAARKADAVWFQNREAEIRQAYEKQGIRIDEAGVREEAVSDYAGLLADNSDTLERFITENKDDRGALEKVRDFFRHVKAFLTGDERAKVERAERRLIQALQQTERNVASGEGARQGNVTQRSIKSNIDGTQAAGYNNELTGGVQNGRAQEGTAGAELDGTAGEGVSERRVRAARGDRAEGRALGQGDIPVSGIVQLSESSRQLLNDRSVGTVEMDFSTDHAAFSALLDEARTVDKENGWAVTPKTVEALENCRTFLSEDRGVGFALAPNGDIEAVFRNRNRHPQGRAMRSVIPQAIANGGTKLDCYGPQLARVYADAAGMVPVCRVSFDPGFANPGWTPDKGQPDVVFMMATDTDPDTIIQKQGTYHIPTDEEIAALPLFTGETGYDDAAAYRDRLLEERLKGESSVKEQTEEGGPIDLAKFGLKAGNTGGETKKSLKGLDADAIPESIRRYGRIKPGENPARDVQVPKKVSRVRSNTYEYSGLYNEVEAQMDEADEENYTYDPVSEKKSMNEALGRLKADFDGEVSRLSEADRQWGGSDLDTAMGILHRYRTEGRATGDYGDFWRWSKVIQEKGTKGGQFIQAFAKYTRTGTGAAMKGAKDIHDRFKLNPAQQKQVDAAKKRLMDGIDGDMDGAAQDAMKQAKGQKEPTKKQDGKVDKKKLDAETQRRKDAERMVREIYNIFSRQQDNHGEPVENWLKLTGEELAKKIASRFDERTPRPKTTMQTILSDLVGFAQEHALPDRKRTEGERRTAIDTITDYLSNRDAYGTAWAQAQAVLRGQYAGDQEKLDALEGFLGATIAYNAEGTDRTMLDAILQSADVLGISEKRILELASAGATESTISRIGDELVNQVQERMGADYDESFTQQLKDAVRRHITGIALSESASEQALRLGRMETAAARQLDINLQKILTESRLTKQDAARRVADYLIRELGIPSSDAAIAAQRISDSFMDELAVRADRRLGQMFAEKTPKAREQRDKLLELLRLGGFTNANVEDAVVDALGIGKLSREEQKRITGDMARFGETLDAITDDDLDGLRALIREQAAARNTPLSRQAEKVLAGETDAEYLRDFALAQLDAIAGDYAELNPGAKISTFQTISHLLNMRTALRNLTSNQVFDLVDSAANNLATIPDMVIGAITGKRTVGVNRSWLSEMKRAGAKQGAGRNLLEVRLDVSPDDRQKSKYGTAGRRTNSMANSNAFGRILSHLEEAMGYELNTTDEFHKGSVRGETLESLARFVERGDITQEQANAWAEEEALYRSFQDDTLVGNIMGELKTLLNVIGFGDSGKKNSRGRTIHDFGLGDLVVKYTQVPGALIHRGIEYSPLGYAKMLYDLAIAKDSLVRTQKRGEDVASAQRKLALDIGRATTGTGLVTLFAVLAKAGLLRRDDDDKDKNAKAMHAAQGLSGTQLNVTALGRWIGGEDADPQDGDVLADIGFLEPLDSLMTIATLLANDKDLSLSDIGTKSLDGIWKAISNTSAMQTISNIIQTVQYHDEENDLPLYFQIPIEIASDSISGFIPSPVRQLAQATDTTYRDQYRSRNVNDQIRAKAANSIPGVRQMLAPKITPLGEDKKYQKPLLNYLNATLNPGNVSVYQSSKVVDELNRVYGETEDAKIWPERNAPYSFTANDEKWTLTPDERTQYQRTRGQNTAKIMEDVMGTDWYKAMDGTAQAEVLNWIGNFSNFIAKKEMLEARGVDYGSATYDKYYSALAGGTPAADVVAGKYSKQVAAAEETAAAETIIAEAKIPEASREEAETMSAEGKRFYAGFLKGGVSDATARKLASELEGSEASGHEQWRMIYNSAGSEGEKAVTSVMTEDMKRNWELAKSVGVSMDDYIKVREGYLDLDGNGSQKQAEWNATLDQFTFSKNETEDKRIKGTLWQIVTGSGSTKNNPYDKEAGQTVIDAKGKGGGKGTGSNAPARIPTLRLPDTPKAEKPSSGLRIRAAAPAQAPRSGLRIRAK